MNYLYSRASCSLALLLCLMGSCLSVPAALSMELMYEPWDGGLADPPHPAKPFFTKGEPVVTMVISDGSDGVAVFNYDNETMSNTGGARGSWQFFTVAAQSAPVTLDWNYTGYHAEKKVYANLEVFVVRDGEYVYTNLVEAGPANCCTPPSGGFEYNGTTTVDVEAGDQYGFRIAGGNSDKQSTLKGTLTVTVDVPVTANSIEDVTKSEDSGVFTIDLSGAFESSAELVLSLENLDSDNPALFEEVSLAGKKLTFTPAADESGTAEVTVRATSAFGSLADATFLVTITPVNDAPFSILALPDINDLLLGDTDPRLDLALYFDDVDLAKEGDTLTYSASADPAGVVNLNVTGSLLDIIGVGAGETVVYVTATDAAGAAVSGSFLVSATDPSVFGDAFLIQLVTDPGSSNAYFAAIATGEPGGTTQTIELITSNSCDEAGLGADAVVFAEIYVESFNANGEAFLEDILQLQEPVFTYVAVRLSSGFSTSDTSACIVAGPDNDSWVRALAIELTPSGELSTGSDSGYLDRAGKARWYKFAIQPGSRATIDLSSLPADYDLFVFKDIAQAFQELEGDSDVDGLNRLGAEFAPSTFAPSTFAPSVFAPSTFAPDAYSSTAFETLNFAPSVFAPSTFAPSTFAPSAYSPSTFAPSTFAPSIFAPENFVSAQVRSLIAVSAKTGTGSELVVADTWNNTGYFYVRVSGKNGAWDLQQAFSLAVELDGVDCNGVVPFQGSSAGANAGGYRSIILWDSVRIANDPENTPAEFAQLEANLETLSARDEVRGVIVDLVNYEDIQALHAQADANTSCPYAENLTASAIKGLVDAYRDQNSGLDYVVLVGGDGQIPFFRYPDQGLLGPEQDYDPPMANNTQSQSALKLNYILGQDEYGAELRLSLRDGDFPLPGLAVGRLVETASEMNTMLEAYLSTAYGVIDAPGSTLVTGYDFLEDVANAIQLELEAGTNGARNDTLITPAVLSPDDPLSWTAEDLRRELLDEGEDIIFLAGHFSANSALAADYKTTALTTELASSSVDLMNALIFSAGCHSGYNIVNPEIVQGVTLSLDWTQAFAQKGATLIAGTGYQYGDTEFIEYSERLYLEFARELRTGSGPVSVGEALVRAKQAYLESTPDIRGLHRKSLLISTLFGLPMLSVDMPGQRIPNPTATPTVTPALVSGGPGEVLGLQSAEIGFLFEDGADGELAERTVDLKNIENGEIVPASYLEGAGGVVSYPAEPTLPLVTRDVTAAGTSLSLRGVGFRGGSWRESIGLPLTGAPATELRGVHTPFASPVYFPMRLATPNYFDALSGGSTTLLHVTPVQHRVENVGDIDAVRRRFDAMDYRLYYSDNTQTYATDPPSPDPNRPALAAPPSMSGVAAVTDGDDLVFYASVVVDPTAGVHSVWVTYTDGGDSSGQWVSLDLEQDPEISTLWSARMVGAANAFNRLEFVLQAVSGTGLVTLDDNFGAFYRIGGEIGDVGPDGLPFNVIDTEMTLSGAGPGTYGNSATLSANLSSGQDPVRYVSVVFTIGGTGTAGLTDIYGDVTVDLPVNATPGEYAVTASFAGNSVYAPSSAEQAFLVEQATTKLMLDFGTPQVDVDSIDPQVSATLTDEFATPLLQRTVYFILQQDGEGEITTFPVITNNIGLASLPRLQLPNGDYHLTVRFLGSIPTPAGIQVLDDPVYEPSEVTGTLNLSGGNNCPTEVFRDKGNANPTLTVTGFCYLNFDVRGKVDIRDGTLIVGEGVKVTKKVDQTGEGGVIVLEGGSIGDKVLEEGPGDVIVLGTVADPVTESGSGDVIVGETGSIGGNVDESDEGSAVIKGSTAGNVKESEAGDLTITSTGFVDGNATELGAGILVNEGVVTGNALQD